MQEIKWNKYFLTGLEEVDNQHKYLIDLVNKLGTLKVENSELEENFQHILSELIDYTHYHFEKEENIMDNSKIDPRYITEHKKIHKKFINDINEMLSDDNATIDTTYKKLFDFLIFWLVYHILGIDKEVMVQITAIDSGMSPEEAYDTIEDKKRNADPLILALKGLFQQVTEKNQELKDKNKILNEKIMEQTNSLLELSKELK